MTDTPTKDRLIMTAARLFRQKGYHGVGVAEILALSKTPKGSLYHHFPNGKPDLAVAAADWASAGLLRIIDDAFGPATDFTDGATTLCYKLAKFFDISGGWDGCPVSSILLDGPENDLFRDKVAACIEDWTARVVQHGTRLGLTPGQAAAQAELLMLGIQGAWVMARARRSSDELRKLPARLY